MQRGGRWWSSGAAFGLLAGLGTALAMGCGGGEQAGSPTDAAVSPPDDAMCRCEFFGRSFQCVEGEVQALQLFEYEIPCIRAECETEWVGVVACSSGCLYEGLHVEDAHWHWITWEDATFLCAGARSAEVGDYCIGNGDCMPQQADITSDGTVINRYLACDRDQCMERSPAAILGFLDDCGALPPLPVGAVGYLADSECGFCLVVDDPANGCVRRGCTAHCMGDHECPPGSICDSTLVNVQPDAGSAHVPVCKPGPPGDYHQLPCP